MNGVDDLYGYLPADGVAIDTGMRDDSLHPLIPMCRQINAHLDLVPLVVRGRNDIFAWRQTEWRILCIVKMK